LALLERELAVCAVEIDPRLAAALPATVAEHAPEHADRLTVIAGDALRTDLSAVKPTALVANLPYNVAVPVVLHLLATVPTLRRGLVMVQKEVADRLTAGPGSRTYGVPSVKLAWYATARQAGKVPAAVFWPVPNVESGLVGFVAHESPESPGGVDGDRRATFAVIDAAFAQRRKTLRAALAGWAGGAPEAERILRAAGVDPGLRGEQLTVRDFTRIASQRGAGNAPG
jgi:16S rRNA (adenine1518-N6/adenine1519-N6)-dimethyltransferase